MTPGLDPSRSPRRGLTLALLTSLLWGTVPVAGKIALGGVSPPVLSVLRLAAAALFVFLLMARRGVRPPRRPAPLLVLAAFGLGLNYVAYMVGLQWAGAGTSQVLIQMAPVFLVLLGVLFLGERLGRAEVLGASLAFLGALLVSWREVEATGGGLGIAFVLLAALAWSIYAVAQKLAGRTHGSGATTFWVFSMAAALNLPGAFLADGRSPDAVQILAVVYLCANTLVAYWAFAESLRHIPASTAGVIATLGPAVTFGLLAVANATEQDRIPYEAITPTKILGAVFVVVGVILTVRGHGRRSKREPVTRPTA